ncbi:cob(I)yrinic acid a,c-diamide adenosyltransferase [Sandaracinus amylolyticus]|uniref:Corrinoid adenosyltransferase n=1 Tax=Sandaracinus amylolyticus TaxID=927083 RepID=A0A0F6W0S7_9BACT|nr:cob(I)yrinic acid a,c-diamide adenosyltransferase [Sandaracinus amylolyticus]AKF04517.1 ATP Cob(I)alamin adenosyltransferase [Sandaracinus amylolyticus]
MKIYTKTGDAGQTGLFGGDRVSKACPRVEAYGDVDELNSVLGIVRAEGAIGGRFDELIASIQSRLFDLGAELANERGKDLGIPLVDEDDVVAMEHAIDHAEGELAPLRTFVLPGGSKLAAHLHLGRTVCRRAERRVVALMESGATVRPEVIRYLNRLSDLLFVLARLANHRASIADVPWIGRGTQKRSG